MKTCRLLIADEQQITSYALQKLFATEQDIHICAVALNAAMLLEMARELQPDVILTDVKMPGRKMPDITRAITAEMPGTHILVFSSDDDENRVLEMMEAGAKGYLLKRENTDEIIHAVRTVSTGREYFSSSMSTNDTARLADQRKRMQDAKQVAFKEREMEVIALVCKGLSSKQIGQELTLSFRTVESYQENIMLKMGIKNRVGLVLFAIRNGLISI